MFDNNFLQSALLEKATLENTEIVNDPLSENLNSEITERELRKLIRKLKIQKSVGSDCIPNEILKNGKLDPFLLKLMQICFNNGIAPSIWNRSIIVPIPKNALLDPCVPLNYRGISLLSCTYKLYTSVLNDRLCCYNDSNGLIADEQNGFRKNRSCSDHIYALTSVVRNRKNQNLDTYCAFIDYQKAFDWVNKDLLLFSQATTVYHGIPHGTMGYCNVPQCTTVYHWVSRGTTMYHSVPQNTAQYHGVQ